jgi:hypothetical protein
LEGGEDRALRVAGPGGLVDGAGSALEGDLVEALQLGCDPAPALAGGAFGDADEEQGEPADDDVGGCGVRAGERRAVAGGWS